MDYTALKIGTNQIRLITLQPIEDGNPFDEAPVRCRMEVRGPSLPTSAAIPKSGSNPSNYINFDHYVKNPPKECFADTIRQDVAVLEKKFEKKPSVMARVAERAANKLRSRSGPPTLKRNVLRMPVDNIANLISVRITWA